MYCVDCGGELTESARFCRKCGAKTAAATPAPSVKAEPQTPPQDDAETVRWWRLAADQGRALAQTNLGVAYANGQGVPRDYVQAHMWFDLAASGTTGQNYELAVRRRDAIAARLTAEEVAEAQRLAAAFTPQ